MNKYALIVAGGVGKRMNSDTPKQFMLLAGKPLLFHSLKVFSDSFNNIKIIVALPSEHFKIWKILCSEYNINIKHTLAKGGETRFQSVKNALSLIDLTKEGIIAIHDAARPLVSKKLIKALFKIAEEYGNAIPSIAPTDSLREIAGYRNQAGNRDNYRLIQTPQCFNSKLLKSAYAQDYKPEFTDDATVVESAGENIKLIEGDRNNIKITTPADLAIAEALYKHIHIKS